MIIITAATPIAIPAIAPPESEVFVGSLSVGELVDVDTDVDVDVDGDAGTLLDVVVPDGESSSGNASPGLSWNVEFA